MLLRLSDTPKSVVVLVGQYNDLATAFLSNSDDTIKHIFSLGRYSERAAVCADDNCYFTLPSLVVLCVSYLCFMALTGALVIPGGLFMPSITVCCAVTIAITCS